MCSFSRLLKQAKQIGIWSQCIGPGSRRRLQHRAHLYRCAPELTRLLATPFESPESCQLPPRGAAKAVAEATLACTWNLRATMEVEVELDRFSPSSRAS